VHAPAEVPASYRDAYNATIEDPKRRTFAGMLSCMDEGIGNVTKALRAKHMLDNSVVVFTTDNGGPISTSPGGDYAGSNNFPLRGGKHTIWEGGTRGTAVAWAGASTGLLDTSLRGRTTPQLMHGADWLPTFCALAGADCSALPLDGVSQVDTLFSNTTAVRSEVFYGKHDDAPEHEVNYDTAIRDAEGWKLLQNWGGLPTGWSVNTSLGWECEAAPQCTPKPKTCCPNNDLIVGGVAATSEAECCEACTNTTGCAGYTYQSAAQRCYVKHTMVCQAGECSSGSTASLGALLFNVNSDPEERHEVSSSHPDVVQRLTARVNALRATKVIVPGGGEVPDPDCPQYKPAEHTDPRVGEIWEPWCEKTQAQLV